ncbi:DUF983 domain-containing protein [Oceanicella actignis]|uniref:DUF983 domain-containing protein n=1 Tax=Oceanicella actignis TaxID=1189325 RepID=UPI0011E634DA|nr:DUF983 domain-containing protein [Oceanicella actignis]TYO88170.1 uncharacterized protein (DUF983 family) [Oceanicella actignis]
MSEDDRAGALTPLQAALRRRCPRCGRGRLLEGFLRAAPVCESCGLDLRPYDAGDGPAFFAGALAGLGGIGAVALSMLAFDAPSAWPVAAGMAGAIVGGLAPLPFLKCFFIAQAWRKAARR